jgi:hypothetical protein
MQNEINYTFPSVRAPPPQPLYYISGCYYFTWMDDCCFSCTYDGIAESRTQICKSRLLPAPLSLSIVGLMLFELGSHFSFRAWLIQTAPENSQSQPSIALQSVQIAERDSAGYQILYSELGLRPIQLLLPIIKIASRLLWTVHYGWALKHDVSYYWHCRTDPNR